MRCPYCGGEAILKDGVFIYKKNKAKKNHDKVWVCSNYPKCDAYVCCHKGTTIPFGRLANARLRTLRQEAHKQFDPIWQSGLVSRRDAYKWLANMLRIDVEDCHIGTFDIKMCQRVIHLCKEQNNEIINSYRSKHYAVTKE